MIASAPTVVCRAPALFARLRDATGAAAWKSLAETLGQGATTMAGLRGTATVAESVADGRYANRFRIRLTDASAQGYDGRSAWVQDVSGGVHALDAPFAQRHAVTEAYLKRRAYLEPNTAGKVTCLGRAFDAGRLVDAVRVQPPQGIPAVLDVDVETGLLNSVSLRLPTTTEVTHYADYREVGKVVLPFLITSATESQPANGYTVAIRRYTLFRRARDSDFQAPSFRHAGNITGGDATTVPIVMDGRQLLVWASINGRASMPFILDTGGHAILTSGAARSLHLHAVGAGVSGGSGGGTVSLQFARVATLKIGRATVPHQTFLVIDYPYSFYERGRRQPIAGILGLEVFERFATRIDYGRRRLTLTKFSAFGHKAGLQIPISFQDDMPLAVATADGHAGLFGIDTGNAGSVILFGDFLTRTHLADQYRKGIAAVGHGTGGSNTGTIVTLHRFHFGSHTYSNVHAFLTYMKSGSFSSWTEAGNLGYEILSRFVPTFDYKHGVMYVDSSPFAHAPPPNRAGFVASKGRPDVFEVQRLVPGSPAAAHGIAVGDKITAIDGNPAADYSFGDLYDLITAPPGTLLRLRVLHNGQAHDVSLVLR